MGRTKEHQKYVHPITNKPVPGVTTFINSSLGWNKNALMGWAVKEVRAGNNPFAKRDKAGSIGTLAHNLIEEYYGETFPQVEPRPVNRDEFPPEDLEVALNAYEAYRKWQDLYTFEIIKSELQLVHPEMFYGGTVDLLAKLNGERYFIDFKTSNGIYNDHIIQLSAYRQMIIDLSPIEEWETAPSVILHLSKKDGRFTAYEFTPEQMEKPWEVFKHCYELYYLKKEMPL